MSYSTTHGGQIFLDGDHTVAFPVSPIVWERPFKLDSRKYVYRQTYRQLAAYWKPMPLSSRGPQGGFLVEESEPKSVSGTALLEFVRTFALVPLSRNEYEDTSYSFQKVITSFNSDTREETQSLLEIPMSLTSRVQYDYFHVPNASLIVPATPYSVVVFRGQHYYQAGSAVDWVGTDPSASPIPSVASGLELVGEDSKVRSWKGFIFERVTRCVPKLL